MSFLLILGYDFVTQHSYFRADEIIVEGCRQLTTGAVIGQTGLGKGINILSINLTTARRRLLAHPLVADAGIRRELPSRIRINIREHQPFAVLDLGRRFIINTYGVVFREAGATFQADLPVVSGLDMSDISNPGESFSMPYQSVMTVLGLGQEPGSVLPNRVVKRIHVDRETGLTLYAQGQVKVIHLGYDDFSAKYDRLGSVLHYLRTRPGTPSMDSIDMNDPSRIVVNPAGQEPSTGSQKEA